MTGVGQLSTFYPSGKSSRYPCVFQIHIADGKYFVIDVDKATYRYKSDSADCWRRWLNSSVATNFKAEQRLPLGANFVTVRRSCPSLPAEYRADFMAALY